MKYFLCLVALLVSIPAVAAQNNQQSSDTYVLLVSFDGFRNDFVKHWNLRNFKRLASEGASATSLIPVYPSKTFPNHYTQVTGLYPENHGLIENTFYRETTDSLYSISDRDAVEDPSYYGGLPLWQYVQQQGKKSASFFWVGSEAPITGHHPDYYKTFDPEIPNYDRINQVMEWFSLPAPERPQFITLYFSFVDSVGHEYGPDSTEMQDAAMEADRLVGYILDELEKLPIAVNLIMTSDHGMYPVLDRPPSYIDLTQFKISDDEASITSGQNQAMVYLKNKADISDLYNRIKPIRGSFTVYLKEETPAHWHFGEHSNIGDILIVAELGFIITRSLAERNFSNELIGVHGYDARDIGILHGFFYAWGPQIRAGSTLPSFESIHIFPLVTTLLQLPSLPNIDGELAITQSILKK